MENREQFLQCMQQQIQFLILTNFEIAGSKFSVDDMTNLIAPQMAQINLETNIEQFRPVIESEIQILSKDRHAIKMTDKSGIYTKGLEGDYSDCIIDLVRGISNAFQIDDIDKDDFLFSEAYQKLDAATASKKCIFSDKDKSTFIKFFDNYMNDFIGYESELTTNVQLQYLITQVFQSKKIGSRVTTKEIYRALEPNCKIWLAKDHTKTESDFEALIDGTLEQMACVQEKVNLTGNDVTVNYKAIKTEEESTEDILKQFHYEQHPFVLENPIKWYPAFNVWRAQDSFQDYWVYIISLMEDQLEMDHEEDDDSYGYTPYSWNYILTDNDISNLIEHAKSVDRIINDHHLYRIGESLIPKGELYAARLKNFETGAEQINLYKRNGSETKRLSFSFMLSQQNDATKLKDIGLGIDAAILGKLLQQIKTNYESIPVQYACDKLGWNDNVFVGSEMIGEKKYYLSPDFCALKSSSSKENSLQIWTDLCRKVMKDNIYAQIILATSFASALVKPLDKTTITMNLCGKSSIGKSTFENLATSIWSKTDDPKIRLSFNATEMGIIAELNDNYGACVVIDDTSKSKLTDFTDLIYEIENSQSKTRLGKDHKSEPESYWKTTILLSSELSILDSCSKDKEGTLRRLYEFHLKQGDLTKDAQQANEIDAITRANYGVAGLAFVRFIFDNGLQNDLEDMYAVQLEITRQKAGENGVEQGMAERSAIILLAAQIANSALRLGFDLESIADCLAQSVSEAVQNFEGNHREFSREEIRNAYNEILPDIQEKAIKVDENYYHVPVKEFAEIEEQHKKKKNELRDLFNRYELTKVDKGARATAHTITYESKQYKVISIVKAVD